MNPCAIAGSLIRQMNIPRAASQHDTGVRPAATQPKAQKTGYFFNSLLMSATPKVRKCCCKLLDLQAFLLVRDLHKLQKGLQFQWLD